MKVETLKLFHERILNACLEGAENTALSNAETRESLSFRVLRQRSVALAYFLKENFLLKKGDVVVCFMPNNIHYPVIFLASALIGAPFCGICSSLSKEEICDWLERISCRALFTTSELLDKVTQKTNEMEIPVFVLGKLYGQPGVDLEDTFEKISENVIDSTPKSPSDIITLDSVLIMALSSGTTGTPKCVLLTHRNFNVATNTLKEAVFDELSARGDRSRTTIALLPFYHASGFWALCYCLMSGHHSVVMNRFDANVFLRVISGHGIDTINLVPSIINFLIKNGADLIKRFSFDLSSVKTVLCGSAAITDEQIGEFLRLFPCVNNFLCGYGMTEVVVLSHITPIDLTADESARHKNSCGKLLPNFTAKIVNTETGEEILIPDKCGELWLKSECVMHGYLNDTEPSTDSNGFYHTGDIVHVDTDGFYYVDGRLKNMIKVNGMQVSPIELDLVRFRKRQHDILYTVCPKSCESENILLSHIDVVEAAVIGVNNADRGEVPKAFVVLAANYDSTDNFPEKIAKIREFVHERVAPFKQLVGGIVALATLPKTASGKIARGMLAKLDVNISNHESTRNIDENVIKRQNQPSKLENSENETFL